MPAGVRALLSRLHLSNGDITAARKLLLAAIRDVLRSSEAGGGGHRTDGHSAAEELEVVPRVDAAAGPY